MKAIVFILIGAGILQGPVKKQGQDQPLAGKMLIINSFNASATEGRKNKKELFARLTDSLEQILAHEVRTQYEIEVEVLPGLFAPSENDSTMIAMLTEHAATKLVVIRDLDVYFEQTHVDVSGTKNDKTRTAYYNICARIRYDLYGKLGRLDISSKTYCEYHSRRNVISGLLAAGPNIMANREDAYKILIKNVDEYLRTLSNNLIYQ